MKFRRCKRGKTMEDNPSYIVSLRTARSIIESIKEIKTKITTNIPKIKTKNSKIAKYIVDIYVCTWVNVFPSLLIIFLKRNLENILKLYYNLTCIVKMPNLKYNLKGIISYLYIFVEFVQFHHKLDCDFTENILHI